jgi:plasmid stabilization system protein ParE
MPRLIWSPPALRDVARLHAFLASKNREAASRAVGAIRRGVRLLADHPRAGRPVDEMPPAFREWPISFGADGYVVRNRHDNDIVLIVAVRHGREAGFSEI